MLRRIISGEYPGRIVFLHRENRFRHVVGLARKAAGPLNNSVPYAHSDLTPRGAIDAAAFRQHADYLANMHDRMHTLVARQLVAASHAQSPWQRRAAPLHITYEELLADAPAVVQRVADYLAGGSANVDGQQLVKRAVRVPLRNTPAQLNETVLNVRELERLALEELPFVAASLPAARLQEHARELEAERAERERRKEAAAEVWDAKHEQERQWAVERFNRNCKMREGPLGMRWHCSKPKAESWRQKIGREVSARLAKKSKKGNTSSVSIEWRKVPHCIRTEGEEHQFDGKKMLPILQAFGALP